MQLTGIALTIGFVSFFAKHALADWIRRGKVSNSGTIEEYLYFNEKTGLLTIGIPGDIILGDSTERDIYPQTAFKENLGKVGNEFNHIVCADINTGMVACELDAGTYTPTLTNVANVEASTAYQCQYMRVGLTVTVSGKVDIDPTLAATSTQLGISLPIASNIGAVEDCAGVAFASGIATQGASILGDVTNNRAQLQYISGDITNQAMYFAFSYQVI